MRWLTESLGVFLPSSQAEIAAGGEPSTSKAESTKEEASGVVSVSKSSPMDFNERGTYTCFRAYVLNKDRSLRFPFF
jgi:hypothetical protein